ncbi:MAG: 50S ribosomal protein L30 [Defluviitaleaceae bacterium]|nr:50S ribosomal protein L30 [Defluviitaleaceae bacterium]MCL2836669.1 50S ribosomal protein L30 [Defluviitaleaceae bacterium]
MDSYIKITLVKSVIGSIPKQRATVQALGLRKTNTSVVQRDNPQIRGMIHKVRHLVKVEPAAAPDLK